MDMAEVSGSLSKFVVFSGLNWLCFCFAFVSRIHVHCNLLWLTTLIVVKAVVILFVENRLFIFSCKCHAYNILLHFMFTTVLGSLHAREIL